MLLPYGITQ